MTNLFDFLCTVLFQWRTGKKYGHGTMRFGKGHVYVGDWLDDIRTGFGSFTEADKFTNYTGDFVDNKRHGYGQQLFPDGSKYEGYWHNDERTGWGHLNYVDGHADGIVFYDGNVSYDGLSSSSSSLLLLLPVVISFVLMMS